MKSDRTKPPLALQATMSLLFDLVAKAGHLSAQLEHATITYGNLHTPTNATVIIDWIPDHWQFFSFISLVTEGIRIRSADAKNSCELITIHCLADPIQELDRHAEFICSAWERRCDQSSV